MVNRNSAGNLLLFAVPNVVTGSPDEKWSLRIMKIKDKLVGASELLRIGYNDVGLGDEHDHVFDRRAMCGKANFLRSQQRIGFLDWVVITLHHGDCDAGLPAGAPPSLVSAGNFDPVSVLTCR